MAPLVCGLGSYVEDTNHALQIFDSFHFDTSNDKQCFIFTLDIKSLYTAIPNDCGLKALAHFLNKRPVLRPVTSTLTRLTELVLTLNTFSFNGVFYRQVARVAMGSKIDPNHACLFVGYIEEAILSQYNGFIPRLYKRYINDVVRTLFLTSIPLFSTWTPFLKRRYHSLTSTYTQLATVFKRLLTIKKQTDLVCKTGCQFKILLYAYKLASLPLF